MVACDFCGSLEREKVYKPIGTKRDVDVCVCRGCGLVFSDVKDIPYSREPNPSGDADWGNIRWCKTQQLAAIHDWLPKADRVLDVGSSRGDFVELTLKNNPSAKITAIEPDVRFIDGYKDRVDMRPCRIADTELEPEYEFIYCCHSLEHTDSASDTLRRIHGALRSDGQVLIEVPNVAVTAHQANIWEFFIDKHNFHFSRNILQEYMKHVGFRINRINADPWNVRILASRGEPMSGCFSFRDSDHSDMLRRYRDIITANRSHLPAIADKMKRIMSKMKVAFWGATTIFDLLIKYGGLDPKTVECLVDTYLFGRLPSHTGVPVQHPDYLRIYQPEVCFILSRLSSKFMEDAARRFGVRTVISFSSMLESLS